MEMPQLRGTVRALQGTPLTEGLEPKRRAGFHKLTVESIEAVANDAVAVTFTVPPGLEERFQYSAGQHLTVRAKQLGDDVRRTYSICSPPSAHRLRVGVRRLPGGLMSEFIHSQLRVGEELEVMEPAGNFTLAFDPGAERSYVAIAAGSGITPILALVAETLGTEPRSQFTLLYGNRTVESTMFLDELADLKDRYPDRLQLIHLFSRQRQSQEINNGRLDREKLARLVDVFVTPGDVHAWLLCGPFEMVRAARRLVGERGVTESLVKTELFFVEDEPPLRTSAEAEALSRSGLVEVRATLDGRETLFTMTREQKIVDALGLVRPDAPFSCKGGVCATCRARLIEGQVVMDHTYALEESEREQGWVLTCQAHPISDTVVVDYDG